MPRLEAYGAGASAGAGAGAGAGAMSTSSVTATAAAKAEYHTQGTVVEIEADSLTLAHQAIPALKWPPMTMPFKLAKPQLAQGLKTGQAVTFGFVKQGDDYVITQVAAVVKGAAVAASGTAAKPAASITKPAAPPDAPRTGAKP